jgi:hypothetical protein
MYICIYIYIYIYLYTWICIWTLTGNSYQVNIITISVHILTVLCIYICMYIYTYVYIYRIYKWTLTWNRIRCTSSLFYIYISINIFTQLNIHYFKHFINAYSKSIYSFFFIQKISIIIAAVCNFVLLAIVITVVVHRKDVQIRMFNYQHIIYFCSAAALFCWNLGIS